MAGIRPTITILVLWTILFVGWDQTQEPARTELAKPQAINHLATEGDVLTFNNINIINRNKL